MTDEARKFGDLDELQRTASVANHLLETFAKSLVDKAEKVDIAPGIRAAAVEMDHVRLIAFVIDVISEVWFYHPELLGPFIAEMLPAKLRSSGQDRDDYDKEARAATFILGAALAGSLDMDDLPEQLGRMGYGPHAVDD